MPWPSLSFKTKVLKCINLNCGIMSWSGFIQCWIIKPSASDLHSLQPGRRTKNAKLNPIHLPERSIYFLLPIFSHTVCLKSNRMLPLATPKIPTIRETKPRIGLNFATPFFVVEKEKSAENDEWNFFMLIVLNDKSFCVTCDQVLRWWKQRKETR